MSGGLLLRRALWRDAGAIVDLVNSAYRGESARAGWTTEADILDGQRTDLEAIQDAIVDPKTAILLAFEGEELLACVQLERQERTSAYLGMLTVKPTRQAAGLGRLLLQESERFVAQVWRIPEIEMTVISVRRELIEWYQRRGYRLRDETRPFPMENPRFGLPKLKLLEFVVLSKQIELPELPEMRREPRL